MRDELSRLTAALNDDERAERVIIKHEDCYDHWKLRKAINDYRAMLKEATYV